MQYSSLFNAFFITVVRYYNYALFGLTAVNLSDIYMPYNNSSGILMFFSIFSASVIIKPIGSIIFGIIGDYYGRVISIKISILITSLSIILISILPGFQKIGWYATTGLIILRLLFLIGSSGDIDAIKIYVIEKNHNLYINSSIIFFCTQVGVLLASIACLFGKNINNSADLWRITFITGGVLGLLSIVLNKNFKENNKFLRNVKSKKILENLRDILVLIKDNKSKFLLATLINGSVGGIYNFFIIFLSVFNTRIICIVSDDKIYKSNIRLIIICSLSAIFAGIIADRIKNALQTNISLIFSILIFILSLVINNKHILIEVLPALILFLAPIYIIPLQTNVQILFSINNRMRLNTLSHSLGSIILSNSTPLISMLLWKHSNSIVCVFIYPMLLTIILFFSSLKMQKYS